MPKQGKSSNANCFRPIGFEGIRTVRSLSKKTFRKVSHINMQSKKAIVQMPMVVDGHHVDRNPEVEKEFETR